MKHQPSDSEVAVLGRFRRHRSMICARNQTENKREMEEKERNGIRNGRNVVNWVALVTC